MLASEALGLQASLHRSGLCLCSMPRVPSRGETFRHERRPGHGTPAGHRRPNNGQGQSAPGGSGRDGRGRRGFMAWWFLWPAGLPVGIVAGNGRIEATQIDTAAKIAGRIRRSTPMRVTSSPLGSPSPGWTWRRSRRSAGKRRRSCMQQLSTWTPHAVG